MANVLVLVSGGLDSMACAAYCQQQADAVSALFVDYGQRARKMERAAATGVCDRLAIPLEVATLSGVPLGEGPIRARNSMLLDIALMGFRHESGLVSVGIHAGTRYPDCSPPFVEQVRAVYDLYTGGKVGVDAPFLEWSKRQVFQYARSRLLPIELTYSCDLGGRVPCGTCPSCRDLEAVHAS